MPRFKLVRILTILTICSNSLVLTAKVAIDLSNVRAIRKVPKEFVSLAVDTALIRRHWGGIDWRKAVILAGALSPAYLRVGGTNADLLLFEEIRINETSYNASSFDYDVFEEEEENAYWPLKSPFTNFTMTAGDLDRLHWFAKWSNLSAIFDLNVLLRTGNDEWDWRANAQALLEYARKQQYQFHFELGNEPDRFPFYNRSLLPGQLADDYRTLRSVITNQFAYYSKSKIVGPAVASFVHERSVNYFETFLKHGGAKSLNALTFHHYYFNGRTATAEQFLDPAIMDTLVDKIAIGKELIKRYVTDKDDFPLWLGETSSAYGGGKIGLTDSFIAGFLWLDKLGLSALNGLDVIIRQSLFGGYYSLLDERSDPRPDYWLTLLYKRLVDTTVLKITVITSPQEIVNRTRFYAHCGRNRTTVFGMNLLSESVVVSFHSREQSHSFDLYLLAAEKGDLLSKSVLLNEKPLIFDGSTLPTLKGIRKEKPVTMPPFSLAFFVFNDSLADCAKL